ncbi:MAG: hypothetical protein E7K81_07450 [Finegoldia magna]|nr:hypothetical protein [Finegoldia magna]MDU7479490.1 hypothetical protein [Finegoldia magna]
MRRQAKSLESQDAWMFILNERIIVNKLIEVLIKGIDYRNQTERSAK